MMPTNEWYYRLDGKPHGPFTSAQFEKLIRGRTVGPDTEVSTDGHTWHSLRKALEGVPANEGVDSCEWMNAPTLLPGQVMLPPTPKGEQKPGAS
jgi:hypothetical protein